MSTSESSKCYQEMLELLTQQYSTKRSSPAIITHDGHAYTYSELELHSTKLHKQLISIGVKPGHTVALCMRHNFELIVSLISTLMQGCVFVILESNPTQERFSSFVSKIQPHLLIVDSNFKLDSSKSEFPILCYNSHDSYNRIKILYEKSVEEKLNNIAFDTDVMYMSKTAETTQEELKYVIGSYVATLNRLCWLWQEYPFSSDNVFSHLSVVTSVEFITNSLYALLLGTPTLLIPSDMLNNMECCLSHLISYKVSHFAINTCILPDFSKHITKDCISLQILMATGDILYEATARDICTSLPSCKLINLYGCEELAGTVLYHCYNRNSITGIDNNSQVIQVGTPISGINCYIIDDYGNIINDSYIPGELIVTGACLTHGYHRDETETHKKFFPFSYSPSNEAIDAYRTGDIAYYLLNGDIVIMGRIEDQITLKGCKINPQKLELTLKNLAFINKAVVKFDIHSKLLVAYIELVSSPSSINSQFWIDFSRQKQISLLLAKSMPIYMQPSFYIFYKSFPKLLNGAIDRKKLVSAINFQDCLPDNSIVLAKSDTLIVNTIRKIFSKYLNIDCENIRVSDTFQELGGYSLLIISLVNDLELEYQISLSLDDVINNSSLIGVCNLIKSHLNSKDLTSKHTLLVCEDEKAKYNIKKMPLSYTQEEFFYLFEEDETKQSYIEYLTLTLEGEIDIPLLQTALNDLIASHSILRTTFHLEGKEFYQKVHSNFYLKFGIQQSKTEDLDQYLEIESQRKFNLNILPLFHLKLFIINDKNEHKNFSNLIEGKFTLFLAIHHILIDGVSLCRLIDELVAGYNTYLDMNIKVTSPSMSSIQQYSDFAIKEASDSYQTLIQNQVEYWSGQLKDLHQLNILKDNQIIVSKRKGDKNRRYGQAIGHISTSLKENLQSVSLAHNTTLFVSLVSCFAIILSKYSQDSDDVIINTPVTLRTHIKHNPNSIIGPLLNVALLRTTFGLAKPLSQHTFSQFLLEMNQIVKKAVQNNSVPLKRIADIIRKQEMKFVSFNELLPSLFVFHEHFQMLNDIKSKNFCIKRMKWQPKHIINSKSDIFLEVDILDNGSLETKLTYNLEIYSQKLMKQFLEDYHQLLNFASNNLTMPLANFALLSTQKYKKILELSTTPIINTDLNSIYQIFLQKVNQFPHKIALDCENVYYTYQELDKLIRNVATILPKISSIHENIIGIYINQSINLVIAVFAALFSGFGYVYLDPELPEGRLEYILQDSNTTTILVDCISEFNEGIEIVTKFAKLVINVELVLDMSINTQDNKLKQLDNDICYIIYTSGSTGRPKGVIITQKNVITRCHLTSELRPSPNDRIAQLSTFNFDIYTYELFCSLLNGATLCILERSRYLANADLLSNAFKLHNINHVMVAPALCELLIQESETDFSMLSSLLISGDIFEPNLAQRVLEQNSPKKLVNLHGISEITCVDTYYEVTLDDCILKDIPIGSPLQNTSIYVVDKHLNLLPFGCIGEILVGGPTVALGYINNVEKTMEKFISNPFSKNSKSMIFRSGDLGYRDFNGVLRFVGRNDSQIQINGYRIELNEIERVGNLYGNINKFVVTCVKNELNKNKLFGCVLAKPQLDYDNLKFIKHLSTYLPHYMIPNNLYVLSKMPTGVTGKIDRVKLNEYIKSGQISELLIENSINDKTPNVNKYLSTFDELEEHLKSLYKNFLNQNDFSLDQNFFSLGGDSIKAIQFLTQLNSDLNTNVTLKNFFQNANINDLVHFIKTEYSNINTNFVDKLSSFNNLTIEEDFGPSKQEVINTLTQIIFELTNIEKKNELNLWLTQNKLETFGTQIIQNIKKKFKIQIDIQDIAKSNTISNLASLIIQKINSLDVNPPLTSEHASNIEYQLSSSQKQFAMANLFDFHGCSHNVTLAIYCEETINESLLQQFYDTFIQRNLILQTIYNLKLKFTQKIIFFQGINIKFLNVQLESYFINSPFKSEKFKALIKEEMRKCFNLEKEIPIRVICYTLSFATNEAKISQQNLDRSYILTIFHHIACDAWSINYFLKEFELFFSNYPNYQINRSNYLELAAEEMKLDEIFRKQREFWQNKLQKYACCEFPQLQIKTSATPVRQNEINLENNSKRLLQIKDVNLLKNISKKWNISMFILSLAAFAYLLTFYCGDTLQIIIPVPFSNRSTQLESQHFGPCVITLPLVFDFEKLLKEAGSFDNLNLKDIVNYTNEVFLEALDNSLIGLDETLYFLKVNSLGKKQLPVIFSYDTGQIQTTLNLGKFGTANVEFGQFNFLIPGFLIVFEFKVNKEEIEQVISYDINHICKSAVNNFLAHYNWVLDQICNNPYQPLTRLECLPSPYKEALIGECIEVPFTNVILQIIEQCQKIPQKIILEDENISITREQFLSLTSQAARFIKAGYPNHDNNTNRYVALFMELSIELIIICIGTLMAGCTFLMIEPTLPEMRIMKMLQIMNAQLIITNEKYHSQCESIISSMQYSIPCLKIMNIDTLSNTMPLFTPITDNPLCYCMFTSGSTGEPKCVAISHKNVLGVVIIEKHPFPMSNDIVMILSSLSFDIIMMQIFGVFFSEALGIVFPSEYLRDLSKLSKFALKKGVTYFTFPTPVLDAIVDTYPECLKNAITLDFGGEAANNETLMKLLNLYPKIHLSNSYGPTEITVFCTTRYLTLEDCSQTNVTIGHAIPNSILRIVDKHFRSVPFGCTGELIVGGAGVMHGYLNKDDETSKKIIQIKYDNEIIRFYRTGDNVRQRDDGQIMYLGRYDFQVKIQGQRLDLLELETIILEIPLVSRVKVLLTERSNNVKSLAAFIVRKSELKLTDIESYLKARLPKYMIPSKICFIDKLPLSENGKIDRNQLLEILNQQQKETNSNSNKLINIISNKEINISLDNEHLIQTVSNQNSRNIANLELQRENQNLSNRSEERTIIFEEIIKCWKNIFALTEVPLTTTFTALGGHSLLLVRLHYNLETTFGIKINLIDLLTSNTILLQTNLIAKKSGISQSNNDSLSNSLTESKDELLDSANDSKDQTRLNEMSLGYDKVHKNQSAIGDNSFSNQIIRTNEKIKMNSETKRKYQPIAVIGMSGQFPSSPDLDTFHRNLYEKRDCVTVLKSDHKSSLCASGYLERSEEFDREYFGISEVEAAVMDPQHRLLLQNSVNAVYDAALCLEKEKTGVFIGCCQNSYSQYIKLSEMNFESDPALGFQMNKLLLPEIIPSLISYHLGLSGPALLVQTACVSSLTAIHMACRSLHSGDCSSAIVGAANITYPQMKETKIQTSMINSPEGKCKSFDKNANGLVGGNGVGVIILTTLEHAESMGYPVYAIVSGSAVNNDGNLKDSFSSSSVMRMSNVINEALSNVNHIDDNIQYIEGHGSGTLIGDGIELEALHSSYCAKNSCTKNRIYLGSVKANIGHLGYAAGMAGFIKSVLQIDREVIYPTKHFIDWSKNYKQNHAFIPFTIATEPIEWKKSSDVRRIGVNGFGQGGNNVHLILEENWERNIYPITNNVYQKSTYILPIATHSQNSIKKFKNHLKNILQSKSNFKLSSFVASYYNVIKPFPYRLCYKFDTRQNLIEQLNSSAQSICEKNSNTKSLVFVLPGQGSHFTGMGKAFYEESESFRHYFGLCSKIIMSIDSNTNIETSILNGKHFDNSSLELQSFIFSIQYCIIKCLSDAGLQPQAIIGHSLGEITVAAIQNVFSLEDALQFVYQRSKSIIEYSKLNNEGMVAVNVNQNEGENLAFKYNLSLSAVNSETQIVLAGKDECLANLCQYLINKNIKHKRLLVPTAYHSQGMCEIVPNIRKMLAGVTFKNHENSYISTVTGDWISTNTACSIEFWEKHLIQPVQFASALQTAKKLVNPVFLEIGPGGSLTSLIAKESHKNEVLPCFLDKSNPIAYLNTLKKAWEIGLNVKWNLLGFYAENIEKLRLGPYPFEPKELGLQNTRKILEMYSEKNEDLIKVSKKIEAPIDTTNIFKDNSRLKIIDNRNSQLILNIVENAAKEMSKNEHSEFDILIGLLMPGGLTCYTSIKNNTNLELIKSSLCSIGCVTSIFVYVIYNYCLETGLISNTTRLFELLPTECELDDAKKSITLFQLATHTSGLPSLPPGVKWNITDLSAFSLFDLISSLMECKLENKPGDQFYYSVFGTSLLTHALVSILPRSYEEMLNDIAYKPASMQSTFMASSFKMLRAKHLQGYNELGQKESKWKCGEAFQFGDGVYTCLTDMLNFSKYLVEQIKGISCISDSQDFMFESLCGQFRFLNGLTNGTSVWYGIDNVWKTAIVLFCNTKLPKCTNLVKLGEFCLSSISGLTQSSLTSNIWCDINHLPSILHTNIIIALNGIAIKANNAPISILRKHFGKENCEISQLDNLNSQSSLVEVNGKTMTGNYKDLVSDILIILLGPSIKDIAEFDSVPFSQLGLDSLLAISLVEKISLKTGIQLSINSVFEYKTINAIANMLSTTIPINSIENEINTLNNQPSSMKSINSDVEISNQILNTNENNIFIPNLRIYQLIQDSIFPMVIEPVSAEVAHSEYLCKIICEHQELVKSILLSHGAILFRGFVLTTAEKFWAVTQEFAKMLNNPSLDYLDGISPRTRIHENIFTSTEYPSKYDMSPHNEMSYCATPPSHITFFCLVPPEKGCGQTPLASSKAMLNHLKPSLVEKFKTNGLRYVCNIPSRASGPGKCWQDTYNTEDREWITQYLEKQKIEFEWIGKNLKTCRYGSATRRHPITNEEVWFNHAHLFHPSELPPEIASALKSMNKELLPKNCTFTNGADISDEDILDIKQLWREQKIGFDWEQGDILLVDNYQLAHGRNKFVGNRKILVSMFGQS